MISERALKGQTDKLYFFLPRPRALSTALENPMDVFYGTGLLGTIGYVVLPTGVSTDVSRDIV